MLAPSSLVSASTRLSAPVCSVLIMSLVKSWRFCTIDRFEPKFDACERSVSSESVRPLRSVSMLSSDLEHPVRPARTAEIGGADRCRIAVDILRLDGDRGGAGLVEGDLQLVAAQQVDAVERGVVRQLVELVLQLIELLDQVLANIVAIDESVLAEPSSVLVVPLAPPTVRSVVERFWMRSLPPSFDAYDLAAQSRCAVDRGDELIHGLHRAGDRGSSSWSTWLDRGS